MSNTDKIISEIMFAFDIEHINSERFKRAEKIVSAALATAKAEQCEEDALFLVKFQGNDPKRANDALALRSKAQALRQQAGGGK